MNKTLNLKANYLMVTVWLLSLAASIYIGGIPSLIAAAISSILGIAAGFMQLRALHLTPQEFRQAETAIQVRRVMLSTKPGKASIMLLWLMGIVTLGCIVMLRLEQPIAVYMAVYTAFAFTREVVALPGLKHLEQSGADHD